MNKIYETKIDPIEQHMQYFYISEQMKRELSDVLVETTNHLIINGNVVFFSGLLYGKLGISLYFFHYWRYTENDLYREYAQHLVDLVKSQIHDDYPFDYERGLAGVGICFNYLKNNGFLDVSDEYMTDIDSKIIKAIGYERRIGLLTGFGRYFVSRYGNHLITKDLLIQFTELLIRHSNPTSTDAPPDTLSLLCDLYQLDIEKEKIEACLSDSIDAFINEAQKVPVSGKLFTLINLSQHHFWINYRQVAHDLLQNIITQKRTQFTNIHDLQWLLHCRQLLQETVYKCYIPEINRKIATNILSFKLPKLDDLFSENKDFSFEGGYAGLGLALISILAPDHNHWTNLLKL